MSQPHDFPFDITDVAELLHLRIRRPSPQGLYVDCPICNDKRGKMHINTQTDTWRCNYCDESGGILKDTPTDFDESVIRIVQEQAQQFINDLFGKLRERLIDLRSGKAVFVGGGSILLKKQIEASGKVGAPIFVDEISANTKGYELLFKAACMG